MAQTVPSPEGTRNATSISFQIIFAIITSIVLLVSMYQAITQFRSGDKMPELYPLTPLKAAQFGTASSQVGIGLQVSSFPLFNFTTNTFAFAGTIWFEFDPTLTSLETIEKFSFEKGTIKHISPSHTKIIHGKMLARNSLQV
jgi:hypothetical protein